jgi:hypothetical protein
VVYPDERLCRAGLRGSQVAYARPVRARCGRAERQPSPAAGSDRDPLFPKLTDGCRWSTQAITRKTAVGLGRELTVAANCCRTRTAALRQLSSSLLECRPPIRLQAAFARGPVQAAAPRPTAPSAQGSARSRAPPGWQDGSDDLEFASAIRAARQAISKTRLSNRAQQMHTGRPCAQADGRASLIPQLRLLLIRFHGVLAPNANLCAMGMRHGSGGQLVALTRQACRAVKAGWRRVACRARRSTRAIVEVPTVAQLPRAAIHHAAKGLTAVR